MKLVGCTFDSKLNWSCMLKHTAPKARSVQGYRNRFIEMSDDVQVFCQIKDGVRHVELHVCCTYAFGSTWQGTTHCRGDVWLQLTSSPWSREERQLYLVLFANDWMRNINVLNLCRKSNLFWPLQLLRQLVVALSWGQGGGSLKGWGWSANKTSYGISL